MICPVCKYDMIVVEYQNIELDYCNSCKGVWFDSGELELLLKSQGIEETKVFLDGILNSREAVSSGFDGGEVAQLIRRLAGEHPPKNDSGEQVISFLEEVFKAPD